MLIGPSPYKDKYNNRLYFFWCDCGEIITKILNQVRIGHVKSCGCIERERRHGFSHTSTHIAWTMIKQRCSNKNSSSYNNLGGKGIKVCERWINSFENFVKDMGEKPKDKKYLVRIDDSKDFSPDNCVWSNNKRPGVHKTHSKTYSLTWNSWMSMRHRCSEIENRDVYYGSGIVVCDRWQNSFENFLQDLGERPTKQYTLHRIDGDGNYEPGNVCWATKKVQSDFRSCTRWIEFNGWKWCLKDWTTILGICDRCLRNRLNKMSIEEAFTKPKQHNVPLNKVPIKTSKSDYNYYHWNKETNATT